MTAPQRRLAHSQKISVDVAFKPLPLCVLNLIALRYVGIPRNGFTSFALCTLPFVHHRTDFFAQPIVKLSIFRPQFRVPVRNKIVMPVVKLEHFLHGTNQESLLYLTMNKVMPTKQGAFSCFCLRHQEPVVVAFEMFVFGQPV